MKRIALVLATFALVASARAEDGAALYQAKCKACHGADGKGSPMGQKMGVKDLTALPGDTDVKSIIENGKKGEKGMMPGSKGKLSDAEIDAIAKYVKGGLK